ncbi:competence protein CoiA family protein [Streptomyces sp. NBC_00724]|uniref:competence protein CoiA family protein n=1 Tax=Streptomyces sp. NBC_00724 TaxID=2975812 RepID=UPI002ED43568|nr:competence protein CoiA family protein [Streptomyces sp. NBC_00724]
MAFRAVHADWGTVFAHLPDLGCGQTWEAVWKVRPPAPIVCAECRHPMHAKTSYSGLRFFAHAPHAPDCEIARQGESEAHHLLKLELASAARDAGAHAELEVRAPDGSWRADVLATDPAGTWRMALEAQLSPITAADIGARTERMLEHGVTSCWFSDRPRPPWLGTVPSLRLATADTGVVVAEGLVKFDQGGWASAPQVPVVDFLRWVFTDKVVPHVPRSGLFYPQRQLAQVWTAPRYISTEDAYLVEEERRHRLHQERYAAYQQKRERELAKIRASNAESRARAIAKATIAEERAEQLHRRAGSNLHDKLMERTEVQRAVALLESDTYNIPATAGWSWSEEHWAGGVPLIRTDEGVPTAVLDPEPGQVSGDAFRLLAGLLLLFPTKARKQRFERNTRRRRKVPMDGWHMDCVEDGPAPPSAPPSASDRRPRARALECACPNPHLVVTISGAEYPAEAAEEMGPAAALYTASCRMCGGQYKKPWRRNLTPFKSAAMSSPQRNSPDSNSATS